MLGGGVSTAPCGRCWTALRMGSCLLTVYQHTLLSKALACHSQSLLCNYRLITRHSGHQEQMLAPSAAHENAKAPRTAPSTQLGQPAVLYALSYAVLHLRFHTHLGHPSRGLALDKPSHHVRESPTRSTSAQSYGSVLVLMVPEPPSSTSGSLAYMYTTWGTAGSGKLGGSADRTGTR